MTTPASTELRQPAELPAEDTEHDEAYYEQLSDWAEGYVITGPAPGDLRGDDAAAAGRALMASARMGRPSLNPQGPGGERARARQVRLPNDLDSQLEQRVADRNRQGQQTTVSQLIREAITSFLASPPSNKQ